MAGKMEPVPGTSDIWLPETSEWVLLENAAREVFARYGYGEVRTPVFERTDLFVRGIGDETEVVQKEMYTFEDRGGRSLTLRPEGTAGVMRAIANQGIAEGDEKRVFYIGPMFRGERPAAGRKRQFHQVGVEAVGRNTPAMDAENIAMLMDYLRVIDVRETRLLLNSRGTAADRVHISESLRDFFGPHQESLCGDCQRRLATNVWRVLDCKNPACGEVVNSAPAIPDLLSPASREFFDDVCRLLTAVDVPFEVAPRLVRGLDYYEHTVFEVTCEGEHLGAQNAVAGGGRYRIALPGSNKPVSGVGFAAGLERLLLARGRCIGAEAAGIGPVDAYVAVLGDTALSAGMALAQQLRGSGWRVVCEVEGRSLKAQMRTANKLNAGVAVIIGEAELAKGTAMCKQMTGDRQDEVAVTDIATWIRRQTQSGD